MYVSLVPRERHKSVGPISGLVDDACFVLDYYRIIPMLHEHAVVFLSNVPLLSGCVPSVASRGDLLGDLSKKEQHLVVSIMLHS